MPTFNTSAACLSKEAPIRIIQLSHAIYNAATEFWNQMVQDEKCKIFPGKIWFWFDEVVAQLSWGDGDPMYVVRGHDIMNTEIYLWVLTSVAHDNGVLKPAVEINPAPMGLHI